MSTRARLTSLELIQASIASSHTLMKISALKPVRHDVSIAFHAAVPASLAPDYPHAAFPIFASARAPCDWNTPAGSLIMRAKAATDKDESAAMTAAQEQLGHTMPTMTRQYVRHRKGKLVKPTK